MSILELTRASFRATITERRHEFDRNTKLRFKAICYTDGYAVQWPDAQFHGFNKRALHEDGRLQSLIAKAIEAGWKPGPRQGIEQAVSFCLTAQRADRDISSDLYIAIELAFADVGRNPTHPDLISRNHELGAAQVRSRTDVRRS